MQKKSTNIIKNIISLIFIIVILAVTYMVYQKYNFNDYIKAEYRLGTSKFERDSTNKCTNANSYKIENTNYNDAMFYKTVEVTPNTAYRVTCKIKTQGVKSKNENTDAGAHISIADTTEKSDNVIGTSNWEQVEFYFNSKNRTKVDIRFSIRRF